MPTLVFYLLVFLGVGVFFLFIHLAMGRLLRPTSTDRRRLHRPDLEEDRLTVYECGEPTIGSAWVQFDLRYYVVALLFVIFDVEVAFFFPWATVFGKVTQLAAGPPATVAASDTAASGTTAARLRELGLNNAPGADATDSPELRQSARDLALT